MAVATSVARKCDAEAALYTYYTIEKETVVVATPTPFHKNFLRLVSLIENATRDMLS